MKFNPRQFFLPPLTPKFLLRIALVGFFTYLCFNQICIPIYIRGTSMEPSYRDGGFNFIWRPAYVFSAPGKHDVVAVRLAGQKVVLLKRIVALEGEWVEFRSGKLLINGKQVDEPYVRHQGQWALPPRQVEKNCVYVVGDNRGMPLENHYFGQTSIQRVLGVPLW